MILKAVLDLIQSRTRIAAPSKFFMQNFRMESKICSCVRETAERGDKFTAAQDGLFQEPV
jgi:hypothetical protein